jgi:hypothetical protein
METWWRQLIHNLKCFQGHSSHSTSQIKFNNILTTVRFWCIKTYHWLQELQIQCLEREKNNWNYYTLHIFFLLYKSNKTIWIFYRKFVDDGDNPVDKPNKYNVTEDNMLSSGQLPPTTGIVLKIRFFSPVP